MWRGVVVAYLVGIEPGATGSEADRHRLEPAGKRRREPTRACWQASQGAEAAAGRSKVDLNGGSGPIQGGSERQRGRRDLSSRGQRQSKKTTSMDPARAARGCGRRHLLPAREGHGALEGGEGAKPGGPAGDGAGRVHSDGLAVAAEEDADEDDAYEEAKEAAPGSEDCSSRGQRRRRRPEARKQRRRSRATPYTDAEVKNAFRTKAMEVHPDQNQENREAAEEKFKEVGKSYEAIKLERKNGAS